LLKIVFTIGSGKTTKRSAPNHIRFQQNNKIGLEDERAVVCTWFPCYACILPFADKALEM